MQSLVGLLLASVITASLATVHLPRFAELDRQRFDNGSASQFAEFVTATERFMTQVSEQVAAGTYDTSPANNPRSVTVGELQGAGVLSARFQATNTFEQSHALIVRVDRNNPTQIEGLALTFGGDDMRANETARLAARAGPRAGLVHQDRPNEVWGASGQWVVRANEFAGGAVSAQHRPTPGHLAALVLPTDVNAPSPPSFTGTVVPVGTVVPKPSCPTGTPEVYVVPVQFSDNGIGLPILGVQAFADDTPDGSGWVVQVELFHEDTGSPSNSVPVEVDGTHGRVAVFTDCA